jgi:hypothetical protein
MGAKPKQTRSAARTTGAKRTPARRVPARKTARKSAKAGSGAGKSVDAYVAALEGWQREAAERLREVIRSAAPSLAEAMKWGQPVYEDNGPVCYFRSSADHLTFGFWRGTELSDPDGRLEGDGDRMKHLKIHAPDEVSAEPLADLVRQGVELNRELGSPTRKGAPEPSEPEPAEATGSIELEPEAAPLAEQAAIPVAVPEPAVPAAAPMTSGDDGWHDEFQP